MTVVDSNNVVHTKREMTHSYVDASDIIGKGRGEGTYCKHVDAVPPKYFCYSHNWDWRDGEDGSC